MLMGPVPSRRLPTEISPLWALARPGTNAAPTAAPSVFSASRRFISMARLPNRTRSVKCGGPNDPPYLAREDLLGKTATCLASDRSVLDSLAHDGRPS